MRLLIAVLIFATFDYTQTSENVRVERVIDGDTFVTSEKKRVRLIGIDAPELNNKYGLKSKEQLELLILGKEVTLQIDRVTDDTDIYGRLLRYVYINENDVNLTMIEGGFAKAYLKFAFTKAQEYSAIQDLAINKGLGIWSRGKTEHNDLESFLSNKLIMILAISILLIFIGVYYYNKK
jgi:micrococcal nuclease